MLDKHVMPKTVVTMTPETGIDEIAGLFPDHQISGISVVDKAGALAGLVSESDMLRRVIDSVAPHQSGGINCSPEAGPTQPTM